MGPQTKAVGPPSPMVAVLDQEGTIVWVNEAWQEFGRANGVPLEHRSVNENYLAITRRADHDRASYIASEIQDVLRNDRQPFTAVYPCRTDDQDHWFQVYATGVTIAGERHGLVLHQRLTGRSEDDESSAGTSDGPATASPDRASNRLVTYTVDPDETAADALLAAFEAIGVDPMQQETTLYDALATDSVERLFDNGEEFRLTVHVWGHPVAFTSDAITIYAPDSE